MVPWGYAICHGALSEALFQVVCSHLFGCISSGSTYMFRLGISLEMLITENSASLLF